jgi:phenylalanyl-tRNA synthetase beta chain
VIEVRSAQIDALIGMHYPGEQVIETLSGLGFSLDERGEDLVVTVPGWRRFDVEGRADLAEEVGRIAGFDLVPSTMLRGALPAPRPEGDAGFSDEIRARRALAAAGLQEVITYSLIDPAQMTTLNGELDEPIRVSNPQSVEQSVLRPSLLGSLLNALRSNLRQRDRVLLYELARTWHGKLNPLPDERRHVGIAMVGPVSDRDWSSTRRMLDFYDLKGIVDALAATFRAPVSYRPGQHANLHPGRTAEVWSGSSRLGILGQLHPSVADRFDLPASAVLVAELDFERLLEARQPLLKVETPSRFPPADRDVALVVDEATPHADVESAIREVAGALLERVQLFDVYRGGSISAGRKSLAFSLRYRAQDRTLDDDEVSGVHARVEEMLRSRFGAEIRGR